MTADSQNWATASLPVAGKGFAMAVCMHNTSNSLRTRLQVLMLTVLGSYSLVKVDASLGGSINSPRERTRSEDHHGSEMRVGGRGCCAAYHFS